MSDLSPYENLKLIAASGKTQHQIRDFGGPSERGQVDINANPRTRTPLYCDRLSELAMEVMLFPWSARVGRRIARIAKLRADKNLSALREEFGFLVALAEDRLAAQSADATENWEGDFGRPGLLYMLGQYWMTLTLHSSASDLPRSASREKAVHYFREFERVMLDATSTRDPRVSENIAHVLRFKAVSNVVTMAWNATVPRSTRGSCPKLTKLVEETGYFQMALKYRDLMPRVADVPFNALAIASVLNLCGHFTDLHAWLSDADPSFRDPTQVNATDFDEDFANFMNWWRLEHGNRRKVVTKIMSTMSGVTAVVRLAIFALALSSAVASVTVLSVAVANPASARDLRPLTSNS